MTATRPSPVLLVPIGMMLLVVGLLLSRSETAVFGLSSDFLTGFLVTASIGVQLFGIFLSARR